MSNLLQTLLLAGEIPAWIRPGSGCVHDYSENGNDGTLSAGCFWEKSRLRFSANTDEVTIADVAALRLTTGTIIALGGFRSITATEYVAAHDNAGAGFSLGLDDRTLIFTGDGVARTIGTNLLHVKCIGATFVSGATPIGYVDGLSVGNFSGAVNVTATAVVTEIGNWANSGHCISPLGDVIFISRVLTATEMAQAYAELENFEWPNKFYAYAKRTQEVEKGDTQLLSGWNLKPAGGIIPDEITTRDLTTINQMVSKPGILGEGMSGPEAGYLATANTPYVDADFATNGVSVECWCRYRALTAVTEYIFNIGGRLSIYMSNAVLGRVYFTIYDSTAATQAAQTAVGFVQPEQILHIIGTAKANGDVRIYVNSVLGATVDTMANFNLGGLARPATWGTNYAGATGIDADFYKPRIYNYELSQEEVSAKYLEGAQAVQFKTDWAYQVSPVAQGGTNYQQIGTRSSPFRASTDRTGRFVIETDTVNGRLCKILRCTVAGAVYIPAELFFDASPTECAFGTWDLWACKADISLLDMNLIATTNTGATTGYGFTWLGNESVAVYEYGVGVVIIGGTASHSTWHRFRLTRSSAGIFTAYIDGVAFGTSVAELTTTTSNFMLFDMNLNDKICLGNVQGDDGIVKYLGVVAP